MAQPRTSCRIRVRLTPRAGRDAIDGWDGDVLRVRVAAPPADGRANESLLRLVADALCVPRARVRLAGGATSRWKLVEVDGVSDAAVGGRLALRRDAKQPPVLGE